MEPGRKVLQALDALDPSQLTSDLLGIQSPTGEEAAVARFLAAWFRSHGVEAATRSLAPRRANVEAIVPGRSPRPGLLLFGHLDTSFPANRDLRTSVLGKMPGSAGADHRPRGGRYVGQDAYNMRAGLAAAAVAVAAMRLARVPLAGTFRFAGLAGESEKAPIRTPMAAFTGPSFTGAGFGARRYLQVRPPVDFAVSTGPSALRVVNAQAGSAFVEITIRGEAAYQGRGRAKGHLGPIESAGRLIRTIRTWADGYESRSVYETGLGRIRPSVTVGSVQAGWPFAPFWSPATCRIFVSVRTNPDRSTESAVAELDAAVRAFAANAPSLHLDVVTYHAVESALTPGDSPLVQVATGAVSALTGARAERFPDGAADGTNDTNVFRAAGIPAIQLGPGERRARGTGSNQPTALVPVSDIRMAAEIYTHLAISLCGLAESSSRG